MSIMIEIIAKNDFFLKTDQLIFNRCINYYRVVDVIYLIIILTIEDIALF